MKLLFNQSTKTYFTGNNPLNIETPRYVKASVAFFSNQLAGKPVPVHTVLAVAYLLIISLLGTTVYGQDKASEIEKLFNWATHSTPGCVCAVSQNGKVVVNKAYGLADLERDVPLTTNSILDAGSVRKQFVAAAVLILVEDGKLALADDVRTYVPQLPDYGHKITIDHLLTHTSGIRDWQPLLNLAGGDPDAMTMILRQRGLNFIPGEEWSYSNSGYVLLTEIIERVSGMRFPEFAHKRLFEPLGMKMTSYAMDMKTVVKNRALAYGKEKGQWKLDMYLNNDRGGAGALLTSPADLLTWNDALATNRLGKFVTGKLHEPAKLNNGRTLYYTRGLSVEPYRGQSLVSHSGGAAGYHTWLGRLPQQAVSIAVMCNSDAMAATAIAGRIMALYVPNSLEDSSGDGPPPAIPADVLPEVTNKAGLFFNEAGEQMRLVIDRGRFRVAGGPGLVPVAKDRFRRWGAFVEFKSQDKFELNFLSPEKFELKSMEGKATMYTRAQPFAPTETELKAFAGRYESDELMALFELTVDKGLIARVNNKPGPPYPLTPIHPDTFQFAGVILQFVRDKTGKIIGLDFSNPLLRKIRFTKLKSE